MTDSRMNDIIKKMTYEMNDEEFEQELKLFDSLTCDKTIPNSEEFDNKMRNMIDAIFADKLEKKKNKHQHIYKIAVTAAVIVILILGASIFTGRTDALFAKMMNLIMKDEGTYTEIQANRDNQNIEEFEGYYYPHYIPKEFELTVNSNLGTMGTLMYVDESKETVQEIAFSYCSFNAISRIDTENCTKRNVLINDRQGVLYSKIDGSYHIMVFQNEEYIFEVMGNVSSGILMDVAKSIKK